jgi:hypothetical protein
MSTPSASSTRRREASLVRSTALSLASPTTGAMRSREQESKRSRRAGLSMRVVRSPRPGREVVLVAERLLGRHASALQGDDLGGLGGAPGQVHR